MYLVCNRKIDDTLPEQINRCLINANVGFYATQQDLLSVRQLHITKEGLTGQANSFNLMLNCSAPQQLKAALFIGSLYIKHSFYSLVAGPGSNKVPMLRLRSAAVP